MTTRTRIRALGAAALALAVAGLAVAGVTVAGPAAARTGTTTTSRAAASSAYVRAAHLSPDTGGVDVYLTAFSGGTQRLWLSDVGYGDVSTYRRLTPGLYAVSMRPHNAPSTTKPALTWSVDLGRGHAYTAAAIGANAALHGVVFDDVLTAPAAGHSLVRVVQASSRAGKVTLTAGGTVLARGCGFGCTTDYVSVPSGRWSVDARSTTGGAAASVRAEITATSRQILSVVVLDARTGGVVLHPLVDAVGSAVAPNGAVPAGGGGTATRIVAHSSAGLSWLADALLAAGLVASAAGGGLLVARRRRAPSGP